ncbi:MAG: phosphoribosylglycinamide formyltransferase [Rhodobacteraceae bacterium]|nr:phosphoribosylglycinamide formyltransferase [Paracoccaceae bacterium]
MISLAILASGRGSNAESIVQYFSQNKIIKIVGIWTNSSKSGVLDRKMGVDIRMFSPGKGDDSLLAFWRKEGVDAIILAGYLKPIPLVFLNHFKNNIINIHPSLLPKHGGKGMYGIAVHKAVLASRDKKTGITVHVVTEKYDEGPILFQCETKTRTEDSPETLQARVLKMEHWAYPRVIEAYLQNKPLPKKSACPQ